MVWSNSNRVAAQFERSHDWFLPTSKYAWHWTGGAIPLCLMARNKTIISLVTLHDATSTLVNPRRALGEQVPSRWREAGNAALSYGLE